MSLDDRNIYSPAMVNQILECLTHDAAQIMPISDKCFDQYRVRPISFSIPSKHLSFQVLSRKHNQFSSLVPGLPYTFHSQEEYYQQYRSSNYAFSPFKGGPDALRHLEILANGCLPLIPGISELHSFNMTHYPKKALALLLQVALHTADKPPFSIFESFHEYMVKNLSCSAMALYMLQTSKLSECKNVLFLDPNLHTRQDYLSLFTLIGLKELFGRECIAYADPSYLYSKRLIGNDNMYGRGFTYAGSLEGSDEASSRGNYWTARRIRKAIKDNFFDVIIFGGITRSLGLYSYLSDVINPSATIFVCGEDLPLTQQDIDKLTTACPNVFIRTVEDWSEHNNPLDRI